MSCIRTFIFLCTFIARVAKFYTLSGAGRFRWVKSVIDIYVRLGSLLFLVCENLVLE